ncbi:MAG: hypothetical protein P8X82_08470, partial [Gemmatimonadales bacterium]
QAPARPRRRVVGRGKVHVLGEYVGRTGAEAEVSDPFGASLEVYRATFDQLEPLVKEAAQRLVSESSEQDKRQ